MEYYRHFQESNTDLPCTYPGNMVVQKVFSLHHLHTKKSKVISAELLRHKVISCYKKNAYQPSTKVKDVYFIVA